jgi:hypothetical protein
VKNRFWLARVFWKAASGILSWHKYYPLSKEKVNWNVLDVCRIRTSKAH